MKSMRFILSAAALLGVVAAHAASVGGSNSVAVIQKSAKKTSSGYQLLVVPTTLPNIAEGNDTDDTLKLSQLLPASLYKGYTVILLSENTSITSDGTKWSADPGMPLGQVFWLKDTTTTATDLSTASVKTSDTSSVVTLMGNVVEELKPIVFTAGSVATTGNATTNLDMTIADLMKTPAVGSQIFVIEDGAATYKTYTYIKPLKGENYWRTWDATDKKWVNGNKDKILPAEAVYYYVP